jgi:hypothetical protein
LSKARPLLVGQAPFRRQKTIKAPYRLKSDDCHPGFRLLPLDKEAPVSYRIICTVKHGDIQRRKYGQGKQIGPPCYTATLRDAGEDMKGK